jgi:hypothetical protein
MKMKRRERRGERPEFHIAGLAASSPSSSSSLLSPLFSIFIFSSIFIFLSSPSSSFSFIFIFISSSSSSHLRLHLIVVLIFIFIVFVFSFILNSFIFNSFFTSSLLRSSSSLLHLRFFIASFTFIFPVAASSSSSTLAAPSYIVPLNCSPASIRQSLVDCNCLGKVRSSKFDCGLMLLL